MTNEKNKLYRIANNLRLVPAVAADVTDKDCYVYQIVVSNIHTSAVTFTVVDKATSAKTLIPTVSLAANSVSVIVFPQGVKMTGGINWVAGTADKLHASIDAYYAPGA